MPVVEVCFQIDENDLIAAIIEIDKLASTSEFGDEIVTFLEALDGATRFAVEDGSEEG